MNCDSLTKKGTPCKNKALQGTSKCNKHNIERRKQLSDCPGVTSSELSKLEHHGITKIDHLWGHFFSLETNPISFLDFLHQKVGMSKSNSKKCTDYFYQRALEKNFISLPRKGSSKSPRRSVSKSPRRGSRISISKRSKSLHKKDDHLSRIPGIGESGVKLLNTHGIKDIDALWNQFYTHGRDLRSFESYLMGLGFTSQNAQECALYFYTRADDMDIVTSKMAQTNIVNKRSHSPMKR